MRFRHEMRFGCARLAPSRQRAAIERARLSAAGRTPTFIDGQIDDLVTLPPNNSSASADFLTHLEELAEDVVGDPHSRLVVTSEN